MLKQKRKAPVYRRTDWSDSNEIKETRETQWSDVDLS